MKRPNGEDFEAFKIAGVLALAIIGLAYLLTVLGRLVISLF